MPEEWGEGAERVREGLSKESSGETTPPSERVVPLKGESTESDLEEEDDEDEAIELKECDEEGDPYRQVRRRNFLFHYIIKVRVNAATAGERKHVSSLFGMFFFSLPKHFINEYKVSKQ